MSFLGLVLFYMTFIINTTKCTAQDPIFLHNFENIFDEKYSDPCDDILTGRNNLFQCNELKINYDKCGVRNKEGLDSRLSGGTVAKLFEFPWVVAIYFNASITSEALYNAAGSLIHPKVVLTIAHRLQYPPQALVVRAGESNLDMSTNSSYVYQNRNVVKIITHEQFIRRTLHNDIALLILDKAFDLTANVRTVCLPPWKTNFDKITCTVSAWGTGENKFEGGIMKLDLPIVSNVICQNSLRRASGRNSFNLDDSFLCAGGDNANDASFGDGGSPLICPIENSTEYYQVGIVAAGIADDKENVPGVYTNIPYLREWIDEKITNENLKTNYYTHNG